MYFKRPYNQQDTPPIIIYENNKAKNSFVTKN